MSIWEIDDFGDGFVIIVQKDRDMKVERTPEDWLDRARAEGDGLVSAGASSGVWPDFTAPPQYEGAPADWEDPSLPDFRLIWDIARAAGYAIGLHGSMRRDCDLIAVPWTENAYCPNSLVHFLCGGLNARPVGEPEEKPNGRVAVSLQVDGYVKVIDLSIVRPVSALEVARRERDEARASAQKMHRRCQEGEAELRARLAHVESGNAILQAALKAAEGERDELQARLTHVETSNAILWATLSEKKD